MPSRRLAGVISGLGGFSGLAPEALLLRRWR